MTGYKKKLVTILLISLLMIFIIKPAVAQTLVDISSSSAILMDAGTGTILFEKIPMKNGTSQYYKDHDTYHSF